MGDGAVASSDLRRRDKPPHQVSHIADGSQMAAGEIDGVVQGIAEGGLNENGGGVLGVDHWRGFLGAERHSYRLADSRQGNQQAANHPGHSGGAAVAENRANADAAQIQSVALPILAGGEIVGRLGEPIDIDRGGQIRLGQGAVAKGFLHAIHRNGTGIDHPGQATPAGRLKDIVRALNVDQHPEVRPFLGVRRQQRRHVDDAADLVLVARLEEVRQLGNIAAVKGYIGQMAVQRQVGTGRGQVKGNYRFAAFPQQADNAGANQPVAPGNHHGHSQALRFLMQTGIAPTL